MEKVHPEVARTLAKMQANGIHPRQVCEEVNIPLSNFYRWKNGDQYPTIKLTPRGRESIWLDFQDAVDRLSKGG